MIEIRIGKDGRIVAMYDDKLLPILDAIAPGSVLIRRASYVEWDQAAQKWGVWDASGKDTGKRFERREDALQWERESFWPLLEAAHVLVETDGPGGSRLRDLRDEG